MKKGTVFFDSVYIYTMLLHVASDLNQRRLKTRSSDQGRAFWVCEQCFHKEVNPEKKINFGPTNRTFMRTTKNQTQLQHYYADHDEMFTWDSHYEWGFVGGPNKSKMADGCRRPYLIL